MPFSIKKFSEAIKKLCSEDNINEKKLKDIVLDSFKQSYIKTILKDNSSLEEPKIKIVLNKNQTQANFFLVKTIKKKVNDDMLEIELDEAKKITKNNKLKYGDTVEIKGPEFKNKNDLEVFNNCFKRIFQRKIDEERKKNLYKCFKDKIGTLVIGSVEKIENSAVTLKIGDTSAKLFKRNMIGDEIFSIGQQVRVYIDDSNFEKEKNIILTRANDGFLRKILEEEIYEIYDKTIVIVKIVRYAGKRSKVSAYSTVNEVSVTGSCIGKGGVRLARVIEQLNGNGYDKERIDIIPYSKNPLIYIINAIKPADAIGAVIVNEEEKKAICVVEDGQFLKAVGLNGVNVKLASKLTGYELTILEETEAKNKNINYITKEKLKQEETAKKEEKKKKEFLEQAMAYKNQNKKSEKEEENNKDEEINTNKEEPENNNEIHINDDIKYSLSDIEKEFSKNKEKPENKKNNDNKEKEKKKKDNDKDNKEDDKETVKKVEVYTKEELKQFDDEEKKENNNYLDDDYDDLDDYE